MRKWLSGVLALVVLAVAVVAPFVSFDTDVDAASTAPVLSLDKKVYAPGEKVTVNWSGLTSEWKTANIELRLDKGHNLDDTMTGVSDYNDQLLYNSSGVDLGESGTSVFPDDFLGKGPGNNQTLDVGPYTMWIFRYSPRKAISQRVEFFVGAEISSNKTTYAVGEDIVINYGELPKSIFWDHQNANSELLIFKESVYSSYSDVLSGSMMYVELGPGNGTNGFAESDYASGKAPAGSFTFPADDDKKVNASLPAGKYTAVAAYHPTGSSSVYAASNIVRFEVVEAPTAAPTSAPATVAPTVAPTSAPPASQYPINITTTKTTFVQGEDIIVSFDGLLESMGGSSKDVELRLDQGHNLTWTFATRPGSKGYADMLKSDIDGSNLFEGSTGSKTFPADDVRVTNGSGSYIAGTGYPVGEYTLWVMDYYGTPGIISNRIEITIVAAPSASPSAAPTAQPTAAPTSAPATVAPTTNPYDMTISVEKLTFTVGEDIVVSFDGYDVAGDHDVEIRLVKGHNMSDADMKDIAYRHDYTDVSDNYSPGTQQDTSMAITASGTRTFPKDGYGNVSVVAGQYSIAAYDYSNGAKQISNLIEITVVEAGASGEATATPGASGATPGEQNKPTGDASMFAIVALIVACAGVSIVLVKKNKVKA